MLTHTKSQITLLSLSLSHTHTRTFGQALNDAPDAASIHKLFITYAHALFDTYDSFRSDNDFQGECVCVWMSVCG
jgi:hypothetical protein